MTAQTPATAKMEKWLRMRVRFFTNFWLRDRIQVRIKKQNPAGVDSGNPDPVPPLLQSAKEWCQIIFKKQASKFEKQA